LAFAQKKGVPFLIESTCNQVNQEGGYTGQTPAQFAARLETYLDQGSSPVPEVVLGGDHLGPYPWRHLPAERALQKAHRLVQDYVRAGYRKIHLDASMRCQDDPQDQPLPGEISAKRTAALCQTAERALPAQKDHLLYIVGSEVPAPGGDTAENGGLQVTPAEEAQRAIQAMRKAFAEKGLLDAWERVAALVVQPGVEFSAQEVHAYSPAQAQPLSRLIETHPRLVYEAHSTDYQTPQALQNLVRDHFCILKVGPELTFAYREAIFALDKIETILAEYTPGLTPSRVMTAIQMEMKDEPKHWAGYYTGTDAYLAYARVFSYSDRIRYYWSRPRVEQALRSLMKNVSEISIPRPLLSQYFPHQYQKVIQGKLSSRPQALIEDKIISVIEKYHRAVLGGENQ
jgi:D-tagatose-1,6-bisphosphate aldolase subunit GatZ/KbaZ